MLAYRSPDRLIGTPDQFIVLALRHAAAMALITLAICSTAAASNDSFAKLSDGSALLHQGQDQAALDLFRQAVAADPKDAQAYLFLGTAYNQIGKPAQALAALTRSADLGLDDLELLFQTARARLGLGEYRPAIDLLLRFELARPGRGLASEYLGRAYLGIGDVAKADAAFSEALRRDPDLRSTVLPYQAALARLRNDEQVAQQRLDDLHRFAPDSATDRAFHGEPLAPALPTGPRAAKLQPFELSLGVSGGFNSNVRGIEAVAVQGAERGASSFYDEADLRASYTWHGATDSGRAPEQLVLSAGLLVDDFPRADQGDFFTPSASLEYRRGLAGPLSISLGLSGDYEALSWTNFDERVAFRAAAQWRFNDRLLLDCGYTAAYDDYLFPSAAVRDPSAVSHTVSIDTYMTLSPPGTLQDRVVAARLGGFYLWNHSDGADFDYKGGGAVGGVDVPLLEHVRAQLLHTWGLNHYQNINSLGDNLLQGIMLRRRDILTCASVRLTRPLPELDHRLTLVVGLDFNQIGSNLGPYRFSQYAVSFGLNWDM